jgi:hypothetical protein
MVNMSEIDELSQFPIITYTNRIQKQMELITNYMSKYTDSIIHIVAAMRMLIANFPPKGKEDLKIEYNKLKDFDHNNNQIKDMAEMVEMYDTISNWAYKNLFQDAFKFRPQNPRKAHAGSE